MDPRLCVKQRLLEKGSAESSTRETGQIRGDLTGEKSYVTSPVINVILQF